MRILIVDDFDTMHKIIRDILHELGYSDTVSAYNGEKAFEILSGGGKIDLIISDWNMPKMTGLELLKKVKKTKDLADIPFIMVTAEAEKERIIVAIKEKVNQYIIKPFNARMLGEKIQSVIKEKSPADSVSPTH